MNDLLEKQKTFQQSLDEKQLEKDRVQSLVT